MARHDHGSLFAGLQEAREICSYFCYRSNFHSSTFFRATFPGLEDKSLYSTEGSSTRLARIADTSPYIPPPTVSGVACSISMLDPSLLVHQPPAVLRSQPW
jgi:hypothetical protein